MEGLNERQIRFVEAYLIDPNATKAAIRAGYSEATAGQKGFDLLKKVEIQEAIQKAKAERRERSRLKADDIIFELEKIAMADARELYEESGRLKRIKDMGPDEVRMLAGWEQTEFGPKVKVHDRMRALELLMKHHGMFDKPEDPDKKDDGLKALAEALRSSREVGEIQS